MMRKLISDYVVDLAIEIEALDVRALDNRYFYDDVGQEIKEKRNSGFQWVEWAAPPRRPRLNGGSRADIPV